MSTHRLLISYGEAIAPALRNQLEAALTALEIETTAADANQDPDDQGLPHLAVFDPAADAPPSTHDPRQIRLALSAASAAASSRGDLHLAPGELAQPTRNWTTLLRTLGQRLDRPGLADYAQASNDQQRLTAWAARFPADPLASAIAANQSPEALRAALENALVRLREADQTAIERDNARKAAEHDARLARKQAAADRNETDHLRQQVLALRAQLDDTAYSTATLRGGDRQLVDSARQSVWRARLAAAQADEAAESPGDHLTWPQRSASYLGETRNAAPHGFGVMAFNGGGPDTPVYRGEFVDGLRHGHGIGRDRTGNVWIGRWQNDHAHGRGALELPDGRRLEGEVAPASPNSPATTTLHRWPAPATKPERATKLTHTEAPRQLAPPAETSQPN